MPVSEQVAERLSDLAYDEWLRRFEEEQEAWRQGLDVRKVTAEDRQREFANYLRTVKRIPYQGYSSFDDNSPDPGCHWEVEERQHIYYPAKYRDVSFRKPQTIISGNQHDPKIKRLVERLREAHWKLTAPKGFASLKGIPELQQLLAYTAADVAHYAAESDELGRAGVWRPNFARNKRRGDSYDDPSSLDDRSTLHCRLSDGGLIGQLAPGLRLCLAAEVATGLLCDSQPPPPDTPEHASALLLFLAAALKQAEQECEPSKHWPAGGSWRLNPSLPNCKTLVDFLACADIQAVLQAGLSMSSACMQAAAGSRGSSSSGSSGLQVLQPADSCDNVLLAAYCLAVSVFSASQQQQHDQQEQQQEQQQQQSVQGLVSEAASMLEAFLQDLQLQQPARPGAAAAAAANRHASQPGDGSSCSSCSSSGDSSPPTAAEVAWHMAVVAGGAALALLLSGLPKGHRPWGQQQQQQQEQQQEQQQQQQQGKNKEPGDADMWTGMPVVQLALLSAAIQALHETVAAVLQDAEVSTQQQQQQGMQQRQQQQVQPHGLQLGAGRQQDSTAGAALRVLKQRVLSEVLAVVETGRAFQEALCQQQQTAPTAATAAAQSQPGHSSSSSSSSNNTAVLRQGDFINYVAVVEAFEAVGDLRRQQEENTADPLPTNPKETDAKALLQLQMLPRLPFSPPLFFQQAFSLLGQQQLSPACLHPDVQQQQQLDGMAAQQQQQEHVSSETLAAIHQALQQSGEVLQAAAAGAARRGAKAAAAGLPQVLQAVAEHGRHWTAAVTTEYCSWLEQQQQQHAASSGSSTSAAAAPAAAGVHAAAAAAGGVDRLQPLVSDPDTWRCFLQELLDLPLGWQLHWSEAAVLLGGLRYFRDRGMEEARYHLMRWRFKQERGGQQGTQTGHQQPGQQQQQQARKQTGKGSSKKQRQHKGGSSGKAGQAAAAAAAGGQEHAAEDGISSDEEKGDAGQDEFKQLAAALEKYRKCDLCELEREAGGLNSNSGSTGSSSSSGSPKASTGLYDSFPVPWSDPYLMRRLLWDLLGRVKPTAQDWFRQHAFMCPHRGSADEWRDVALSLARQLWGPPGEWDDSCEESVALLLPLRVREPTRLRDGAAAAEDAVVRGQYAQRLSAAYAQQGQDGQVAAVLSLQALLSLDPHGGRVQPRPELLFYTPAGFHAAVAKTLMQALQPVPQNQRLHLQATARQAHAGGSGLSNGIAAVATGNATQQQQQQEQQQTEEEEDQHSTQPHYLQAWTSAALPVWYVWWHVGLLAYQQQQQQQAAAAGGSSSSRGASAKGSSGGGGRGSRGVHTPREALKELYASPDARLFAVGYAASQVSSRAQLERLLSNSPTAAAGLGMHPADWTLLGQCNVVCAQCSREVDRDQLQGHAFCCRLCWSWFCSLNCLLHRCQTGGCRMDPRIKAKSTHRWRVLDLLKPSMLPQAAAAAGSGTACIPAATRHALPGLFASLLQQQESRQAAAQKQRVPGQLQWQKQQQPGLGYCPVLRLFETPPWGLAGIHETWDGKGKLLRELTVATARQQEVKGGLTIINHRDDMWMQRGFWEKAQHWRRMSLTPRQQRLEDQRQQRAREQQQQHQHQQPSSWDDPEARWSFGQQGRFAQQQQYGPYPSALRTAAQGAAAEGAAEGGRTDYDPAAPPAYDSDSDSGIGSSSGLYDDSSMVDKLSSLLGRRGAAEGVVDGIDAMLADLAAHDRLGGSLDGSGSDADAGSSAVTVQHSSL